MIVIIAIYRNLCAKSKDKHGSSKVAELASSLMLSKEDIDEVYDFLKMQKIILSNKYNQLENEAAIINLDAIKYKLENNKNINIDPSDTGNLNPFLIGNMDIQVKGNSEIDKLIHEKNTSIINTNVISKYPSKRSRSDHSREEKYDRNYNREGHSKKQSRSRSRSRDFRYRSPGQVPRMRRSRSRSRSRDRSRFSEIYQLYVNFNGSSISKDDLMSLFSKYGKIISIEIASRKNFAFVDFEVAESMNAALHAAGNSSCLEFGKTLLKVYKGKKSEQNRNIRGK
jgi:hypothetical protein